MKKIAYLLIFLGCSNFVTARDLPSQACLLLDGDKVESCLNNAHSEWDNKLNTTYKNVTSHLSKDKKVELRNQQRTWIKERDKKCEVLSTATEKKACYLNETQLKTLALEEQETNLIPKIFEGDWRVKYGKKKYASEDYLDDEDYGDFGGAGDDGFTIVQNGRKFCGVWEAFSLHSYSSKSFEGNVLDINTAQTTHIYDEISKDATSYITFRICNDKLYSSFSEDKYKTQERFSCPKIDNWVEDGLTKKVFSNKEKLQFIKENPWVESCLNTKEKQ